MEALSGIFKGGLPGLGAPGGTAPTLPGGTGGVGGFGGPGILSKILPAILAGSGIFGTIGNIQANQTRNKVLQQQINYTNMLEKMTPAQIMQGITSLERPLSQNLTSNVGNTVQGQLAERGLSQAPGIYASSLAQGLAPYQLQEQQLAQDAFFKKLGLPISARPSPFGPFPQTTNTSQIWQALMQRFMGTKPSPNNQVPELPTTFPGTDWTGLIPGLTPSPSSDFPSTQPGGG